MTVLKINCRKLDKRRVDFAHCNKAIIYAPNGVMKSSLAQVLDDISKGKETSDRIFPNVMSSYTVDYYTKEHKAEAVRETFRICKDRNILKEFIESHEKEAADIMVQLYDQREVVENYGKSQYAEGETTATLDNIRNLMESLKITAEQAMKLLKISAADQSRYQMML
ncbi:MAG: hypothetical protein LUD07_04485 [Clostridiales bacterium]|nr:hypothetical protein [Clostridiales bacterium]